MSTLVRSTCSAKSRTFPINLALTTSAILTELLVVLLMEKTTLPVVKKRESQYSAGALQKQCNWHQLQVFCVSFLHKWVSSCMKQGYGVCHQAHNTSDFQTLISLFDQETRQHHSWLYGKSTDAWDCRKIWHKYVIVIKAISTLMVHGPSDLYQGVKVIFQKLFGAPIVDEIIFCAFNSIQLVQISVDAKSLLPSPVKNFKAISVTDGKVFLDWESANANMNTIKFLQGDR